VYTRELQLTAKFLARRARVQKRKLATTSVRATIEAPKGETIFLTGFPGLDIWRDGSSFMNPDTLEHTLGVLEEHNTAVLYVFTEPHELPENAEEFLKDGAKQFDLEVEFLPTEDCGVPDAPIERQWSLGKAKRLGLFAEKKRISTVCHYGAGRSGMFAASALVEQGYTGQDAVKIVKTALSNAISTPSQQAWARNQ
jgi:protein-tyrosine phosphatase